MEDNADQAPAITFMEHILPAQRRRIEDVPAAEMQRWWKFKMRGFEDEGEIKWWFASTAIPLLAATIGPLANVLSLAALVTYWRMSLNDGEGNILPQLSGKPFRDPRWCYWLNVGSLVGGFSGNIFLLFNFTGRIRYIIALPMTIIAWYIASAILVAILLSMHTYVPPIPPLEIYTQGFWYGVIAAVLYFSCALLCTINLIGYFLGHYPEKFHLTDQQRSLILQTMLFFVWLAGGGAVFSKIETDAGNTNTWAFVDGLYFCDVTILTIGFGDLYPQDGLGRGLVFPYSVGGIILLGLVIHSISQFVLEVNENKVIRRYISRERSRTLERTVTDSREMRRREYELRYGPKRFLTISAPFNAGPPRQSQAPIPSSTFRPPMTAFEAGRRRAAIRKILQTQPKLLLLRDEKDRFNAMRDIQSSTARFRRWWDLFLSVLAFAIVWTVGAVVFWLAERSEQGLSYFNTLYFCYVSLLTIGYGDIAPKSNAGRCFFVVWSLIAVPTMTILISDMSSTVIELFKRGTFKFADFTVLPKKGVYRDLLDKFPFIRRWLHRRKAKRQKAKRMKEGIPFGHDLEAQGTNVTQDEDLETLSMTGWRSTRKPPHESVLARRLGVAIRKIASDISAEHERKYTYEEWVEFTRLIRFTSTSSAEEARTKEEQEGTIEWDWLGVDSPLMSGQKEAEFVLERLCESLVRYIRRMENSIERDRPSSTKAWSVRGRSQNSNEREDDFITRDRLANKPELNVP